MPPYAWIDSDYQYPPYNIAMEELLRSKSTKQGSWFLTYRNQPSVIIGRNQEALAETSTAGLASGIPIFRRTTGGGAVYHDEGNLNWAFIQNGSLEDRSSLVSLIIAGLRSLGLDVREGARGGLYIESYKIGGTASSVSNGSLLFHGTILIQTDLEQLHTCLAAESVKYRRVNSSNTLPYKGIASVPSPVANISSFLPTLSVPVVKQALHRAITHNSELNNNNNAPEINMALIQSMATAYEDPTWIYKRLDSHSDRKDHHESARDFRQLPQSAGRCSPGLIYHHR